MTSRLHSYKSVVKITYRDSISKRGFLGSGVIISPDGVVLTNNHVIEDLDFGTAFGQVAAHTLTYADEPPMNEFLAELLVRNDFYDLAVLKLQNFAGEHFVPLFDSPIFTSDHIGEQIRVIGYPSLGGETLTITRGIVSGFDRSKNLKTDAEINHGNSGGGAFDEDDHFIGVPSFIISENSGKIGFMVPVARIQEWLAKTLKSGLHAQDRSLPDLFRFENIDYQDNLDQSTKYPRILGKFAAVEGMLANGMYEDVIPQIEFILEKRPTSPRAYHYLGNAYLGLGKNEEARHAYRRCLFYDPYFVPALGNYSVALANLHRYHEALETYDQILEITEEPNEQASTYNNIGRIHQDLGNSDVARSYYEKALAIDSQLAPALQNLRDLFASQSNRHTGNGREKIRLKVLETFYSSDFHGIGIVAEIHNPTSFEDQVVNLTLELTELAVALSASPGGARFSAGEPWFPRLPFVLPQGRMARGALFFRGLENWQSGLPKEPLPGMLVLEFFSAGRIEKKVEVYSLKTLKEKVEKKV